MKKLVTLLLAAGMVFSAANGASAVEMKVSGNWQTAFTFSDNMYNSNGGVENGANDGSFAYGDSGKDGGFVSYPNIVADDHGTF